MVWQQRDGRWYGEWAWSPWIANEWWRQRLEKTRDRAIRAWDVADAPQEVLLWIVKIIAGCSQPAMHHEEDRWLGPKPRGLHALSLV